MRKKISEKSSDLKDAVKDSISGWLDNLQKGVDQEVKQEKENTVPKMNSDII